MSLENPAPRGKISRVVPLRFQSLRSSSSGNCVMLFSDDASILIDCGIKTQKECRALLGGYPRSPSAVLVSHAHGDHICYSSLRVLEEHGTPVHCHRDVMPHVHRKHAKSPCRIECIRPFGTIPFRIGGFDVQPVALPHEPGCPTYGFAIRCGGVKVVICTDFHSPDAICEHLVDADFVFIESNHDPELLRRFPNYASHYHMSNPKTAGVLAQARRRRNRPFKAVMLGHLSEQRNDPELAMRTVRERFAADRVDLDFDLHVAPRREASRVVEIH
ncbi:MAG: MBL fold metallo-hydrolase [Tepidisphaeraceae bacterium]